MNTAPLERRADEWREEAEVLRRRGAPKQAQLLESAADELDERLRQWQAEKLTAPQAAEESGYTAEHLAQLVRDGTIPNAGKPGAPRIRRRHLPRKPGRRPNGGRASDQTTPSRMQVARSVVDSD